MNPSVQAGETPRTDLAASKARFTGAVTDQWGNTTVAQGDFEYVTADFARQLERELTALQSERGAVEALTEMVRLKDLHKHIEHEAMEPRERDALKDEYERCIAPAWEAARAVTRGTRSSPLR